MTIFLLSFRGIQVDLILLSGIFLGAIQGEEEERVSVTRRPQGAAMWRWASGVGCYLKYYTHFRAREQPEPCAFDHY